MKKLFLMVSALLTSGVIFAQWTKPVIPAPETTKLVINETDALEPVTQYLYNVEAGGFFCGANDWNTRASISPKFGYKFRLADNGDGTVTLNDSVDTQKQWKAVFADNAQSIWVDNLGGAHVNEWAIEPAEGDYFYITNWGVPAAEGHGHLGMSTIYAGAAGNTRLWMYDSSILGSDEQCIFGPEDTFCDTWAAVSVEAYEAYQEKNAEYIASYDSLMAQYNAAVALKATLGRVLGEKSDLDVADEQAVYANYSSTADELNAAVQLANDKLAAWKASLATVDNPADATDYIVNPNFDGIKFDGWKGSSFGAGGATDECGERYSMNYDTYQEIEKLPVGIYRVNVNAFYRAGSIDNDWATRDDFASRHAKLYAISGEDTLSVGVRSLASVSTERTDLGGVAIGSTGRYAPNSMQDFVRFENAGIDMDNSIVIPVLDGKLKIGVKKDVLIDTDWTITDTWRLTYYGGELEAFRMWSEDVIKTIAGDLQDYITEDTYYCRAEIANFQAALQAAREATTIEDIHANTLAMTAVTERALASIDAYNKYAALVNQFCNGINDGTYEYNGALWEEFCDYVQSEEENTLAPGELTGEEITAKGVELQKMFEDAVKASIGEGDDCTDMLVNASFKEGFKGWTNSNGGTPNGNQNCGLDICKNVEVYDGVVDVQQIVEGVPDGIYSLTCQAFERPAANGSFDGTEASKVFLFMNDFKTPVQNICKDAVAPENAIDKENCYITEETGAWPYDYQTEYGWIPNSVDGASYAFASGRYWQTVYGLVEGGKMTIGLTSNGQKAHWVLWAKFQLKYEGKSAEAVSSVIESLLPGIEEYLESNKNGNLTDPAALALEDAIDEAKSALNGGDGDEMYAAMVALNAAYDAAQQNAAVVAQVQDIYNTLANTTEGKVAEMDEEELFSQYEKYFGTIDSEEHLEFTTEELSKFLEDAKAFMAQVDDAYVAWQQETAYNEIVELVADASDDAPAELTDYLANPDLSTGNADGWTLDLTTYTNKGYQANNSYNGEPNEEGYTPSCNQFIEVWRSGNAPILGDIYQKLMLPEGTYKLSADIIASYQADGSAEVVGCYLYAGDTHMQVGTGNGIPQHFELVFKVAEDRTVVQMGINCSETTNANWLAADNFTLTAYGKDSQLGTNGEENAIEGVVANRDEKAIYSLTGVRMNKINRAGLYIVNGKKVLVK